MAIQNLPPNKGIANGSAPMSPSYPVTNAGDAVKAPFRVPNLQRHPYTNINPSGRVVTPLMPTPGSQPKQRDIGADQNSR